MKEANQVELMKARVIVGLKALGADRLLCSRGVDGSVSVGCNLERYKVDCELFPCAASFSTFLHPSEHFEDKWTGAVTYSSRYAVVVARTHV